MRDIGAVWLDEKRCRFRVWAPRSDHVRLHVVQPENWFAEMVAGNQGYHQVTLNSPVPGIRYRYQLSDGHEFPDPASSFQPEGVHGPSELIPAGFSWTDADWRGIPLETYIIYEIHT